MTAARTAGAFYLATFLTVVYANFAIVQRLIVSGDAAQTAQNFLAHERLLRVGIALDLFYCAGTLALLAALYVLLEPVSRGLALFAAVTRLMHAILWALATLELFTALRLIKGAAYLRAIEPERLQALARFHLSLPSDQYYAGLWFYALASTFTAWLFLKSSSLPKALAWFGVVGSAWCVVCAVAFTLFGSAFSAVVNAWLFDTPMGLFELAAGLWLLKKGARR